MPFAFSRLRPAGPVVYETTAKARQLVAHGRRDIRTGPQRQAARQVRRAAAGFNQCAGANCHERGSVLVAIGCRRRAHVSRSAFTLGRRTPRTTHVFLAHRKTED